MRILVFYETATPNLREGIVLSLLSCYQGQLSDNDIL